MKRRPIAAAIAIAIGLIVLLGYFIPQLDVARQSLVQWAIIISGAAVLVGVGNLFLVHFQKIRRREKGSSYSLLLLVSMLGTLLIGVVVGNPSEQLMQYVVESIILPVEASLMALLAVTLVYASIRLLRRRADWMTIAFLASAVLMLASTISLPFIGTMPILGDLIGPWLTSYPVAGGARGLLLGVALGALTTGLRVIFGMDRPYGGK